MELLEYQAKELFRMVGIPTLPSQTIKDSRKIKQLQIPYPVVLKSQVRSGGRGKAGGIKFVANTIDAIAAARTIFNLSILGEYPEVILAEAHYNAEREFFLAIVLDYDLQCPVLLGSAFGGMNVNALLSNLQQVVVNTEFSIFYARRLVANMGLSGKLICSVSEIVSKMYCLFQERDLDIIEINPLGVNVRGELMALDGKITINERAVSRQPIVETLDLSRYQKENRFCPANWYWLGWQNKTGKIATVSSSFDLALLSWDILKQNKINPACGIVIDDNFTESEDAVQFYKDRLKEILTELTSITKLKAILIDICLTQTLNYEILQTVVEYARSILELDLSAKEPQEDRLDSSIAPRIKPHADGGSVTDKRPSNSPTSQTFKSKPEFILRLLQPQGNIDFEDGAVTNVSLFDSLEDSISRAIAIVKS